jgi:hypothetical protein
VVVRLAGHCAAHLFASTYASGLPQALTFIQLARLWCVDYERCAGCIVLPNTTQQRLSALEQHLRHEALSAEIPFEM